MPSVMADGRGILLHNGRSPVNATRRRSSRLRGHVHLDLAILVFLLGLAWLFLHTGLVKGSLGWFLFGAWGLCLGLGFPVAMFLTFLIELARGKEGDEGGLILLGGLAGGMAGAVWSFLSRSPAPGPAGLAVGCAAGAALALRAGRLPRFLQDLGDMASEAIVLTAMSYVLVPFALFLYAALVLPFIENGFSDGLKIALVMGTMTAGVLGFFWALSRFPLFARLTVSALLFGLMFGFAAFLTLLFFPTEGLAAWKVYAALGAEALAAAAVCGRQFVGGGDDGPKF